MNEQPSQPPPPYAPSPYGPLPPGYPAPAFGPPPSYLYAPGDPSYFTPQPPRVWSVFVVFICALVAGFGAGGVVALMAVVALDAVRGTRHFNPAAGPDAAQEAFQSAVMQPEVLLPSLLATQLAFVAVTVGAAALSPVPLRRRLRLNAARLPWYGYPIVALGTLAIGLSSGIVIEMLGFGDEGVLEDFERAITGMRGWVLVLTAAVIGLSPGFGEEFLFRGYMQTRLVQRWPRLLAVFVTAVLFGVMHMDLYQGAFAILMGLWVGEVTERTGSIWPAVVGHTFNNAAATVLGAFFGTEAAAAEAAADAAEVPEAPAVGGSWLVLAIACAVFLVSLIYILRRPVVPPEPAPQPLPPPFPAYPPYAPAPGTGTAEPRPPGHG